MRVRSVLPLLAAGLLVAAAPAADQAGSSEAETVERACDAEHDTHYDPPSGEGLPECLDENGQLDATKTYQATHWTNDVACGSDHQLVPGTEAAGVVVSGNFEQAGTGGEGFLQACSDGDLPVNGRATLDGGVGTEGAGGSLTADGDRDNEVEQLQGWATVDAGEGSVTCGQAYEEGGRADAANPTENDGTEHCG